MDASQSVPSGTPATQSRHAFGCPQCGHRGMRHLGYMRSRGESRVDCDSPVLWLCLSCSHSFPGRCNSHRASRCAPCSERYRRLLARVALGAPDRSHLYLLTLTAPGARAHRRRGPFIGAPGGPNAPKAVELASIHAGLCGCDHSIPDMGQWNSSAGKRWNAFITGLRRRHPDIQYFRAAEDQKRGALHHHVIVASDSLIDPYTVQALGLAAGYGCVAHLERLAPGSNRHAWYVSKYVTKAVDARNEIPWRVEVVDHATGEIRWVRRRATFRAHSQSHGWALSIGEVRAAIRAAREQSMRVRGLLVDQAGNDEPASGQNTPDCSGGGGGLPPSPEQAAST